MSFDTVLTRDFGRHGELTSTAVTPLRPRCSTKAQVNAYLRWFKSERRVDAAGAGWTGGYPAGSDDLWASRPGLWWRRPAHLPCRAAWARARPLLLVGSEPWRAAT